MVNIEKNTSFQGKSNQHQIYSIDFICMKQESSCICQESLRSLTETYDFLWMNMKSHSDLLDDRHAPSILRQGEFDHCLDLENLFLFKNLRTRKCFIKTRYSSLKFSIMFSQLNQIHQVLLFLFSMNGH